MAVRTPQQLAWRRRIERVIALAAPALDVVLYAGEQLSKAAGGKEVGTPPPRRRAGTGARTSIGGPPTPPGP